MNSLQDYYKEARKVALAFRDQMFPIDKLHVLIGHKESVKFRFADGVCNLKVLREILSKNSEGRSVTGFKYKNKEGVVKMRINLPKLAELVVMNYDIKIMELPYTTGDFILNEKIMKAVPDLGERKKLLDTFFAARCTGVNNYDKFQTIMQCVREKLSS